MNDEPKRPVQATIFTYQVGFGDCILIRITYSDGHLVHILNDFGTTGLPEDAERERRLIDLAEQVMVGIGERYAVVIDAEKRAGAALREFTEVEGLSLGEAVEWCADTVSVREATRLRRLADADQDDSAPATTATAESGGAGAGTAVG